MRGARTMLAGVTVAAALTGCGGGSAAPKPASTATVTAAARELTVTIGPGKLVPDRPELRAGRQVAVHLKSTQSKPEAVTLVANGQVIGEAPHVRRGDTFSVVIPRLEPGTLVIRTAHSKITIKVA